MATKKTTKTTKIRLDGSVKSASDKMEKFTATSTLPIRHGDVVLHPIAKRPLKGLKRIPGGTLAQGTATGHSHSCRRPQPRLSTSYRLVRGVGCSSSRRSAS